VQHGGAERRTADSRGGAFHEGSAFHPATV
jgi:hypothetical protein